MAVPATATDLPQDIVEDILSLLPVKSLMRFRSVCKAWYNLFQNQDFISKHHNKQIDRSNLIAISENGTLGELCFVVLSSDGGGKMLDIAETMLVSLIYPDVKIRPMGPVNGLFCIYNVHKALELWNPATREIKHLPVSPIKGLPGSTSTVGTLGFGFDDRTNDYKIIRFVNNSFRSFSVNTGGNIERSKYQVELYSLKNDSWKEIPPPDKYHSSYPFCHAYNDGVLYWGTTEVIGPYVRRSILCFSFANEVFEMLHLPDFGVSIETYSFPPMMVFNAMLSVMVKYSDGSDWRIDLWVMKEHGVEESWEKQLTVGLVAGIQWPLGFWKNNFFFEDDEMLFLYDPCTRESRNLEIDGEKSGWRVTNYVESLVALNGKRGTENEHIVCKWISK